MIFDLEVEEHILEFNIPAVTSRNVFTQKKHWILKLKNNDNLNIIGIGEAAPLEFLSPDYNHDLSKVILHFIERINKGENFENIDFSGFPSVKFAIESAIKDLQNGGKQIYYKSDYLIGKPIPINGLVWMNDTENMLNEAIKKSQSGFNCIKFKVGKHDFDSECKMLEAFRKSPSGKNCIIRLDANGAFAIDNALEKLHDFSKFNIHSIEQPIKPNQPENLAKICRESKIKIALDEELININNEIEIENIIRQIKPHFIVLKPTLIGGISNSLNWIKYAQKHYVGWWVTSALESNIGLNIIAQWAGTLQLKTQQGLGTGKLYKNNFAPKSTISDGLLYYKD